MITTPDDRKKPILVYITAKDNAEAEKIASILLEEKLVACANIVKGVSSMYWWKGSVQRDEETVLICKSLSGLFTRLNERVLQLHGYDVPCVVALPIIDGNPRFIEWIGESCA